MSRHFAYTIVRVRAPLTTDEYRNKKRDWDNAARLTVSGVNVQPAGSPPRSDEEITDRQTTVTQWRLSTPPGTDVDLLETDQVEWEGLTLEVDGKVGRWRIAGRVHHVEANLREVD